jgi:excisionase family DNA binding protein
MAFPLTPDQVAKRLGRARNALYVLLRSGKIPAYRVGRRWLIPESALKDLAKLRPGRPRKPKIMLEKRKGRTRVMDT